MESRPNRYLKFGNNITLSRTEDYGQNDGGNALSGAMAGAMRAALMCQFTVQLIQRATTLR